MLNWVPCDPIRCCGCAVAVTVPTTEALRDCAVTDGSLAIRSDPMLCPFHLFKVGYVEDDGDERGALIAARDIQPGEWFTV